MTKIKKKSGKSGHNKTAKQNGRMSWIIKGITGAFLIYILLSIVFSFKSSITTSIALKGTVVENFKADGYIFREQSVINAPVSGYLECCSEEGERVNEGQDVGYIYTGEFNSDTLDEIRRLNDEIAKLENSLTDSKTYANNSVLIEQKIGNIARELSDLRAKNDMSITAEYKEDIDILVGRKYAMESGGTVDAEATLADLKKQLQNIENGTAGEKMAIHATASGVFSSKIDGLEDELAFGALEGITPSYLEGLKDDEIKRGETVIQDEAVCKIVDNYEWYFAANIDAKNAENIQVGQELKLRFFDLSDTVVEGTVKNISGEENGKVTIVIYTNRFVEDIYSTSKASVELITTSAEGIKIPVESLRVKDGQTGVYVLRLDVARFVPVDVKYKNADWAIVSAVVDTTYDYRLQIYDEVIVEAKNLEDGKVVR